jgi:hypothetical protein
VHIYALVPHGQSHTPVFVTVIAVVALIIMGIVVFNKRGR